MRGRGCSEALASHARHGLATRRHAAPAVAPRQDRQQPAEFAARPKADEIAALRSENERLRAQQWEHAIMIADEYRRERDDLRQKLAAAKEAT